MPKDYKPWPRPEPRPPLEARPTQLSVSSVEQWRRDPYGLYARRSCGLRPLDPLEAGARRGRARARACTTRSTSSSRPIPGRLAAGRTRPASSAMGERHLEPAARRAGRARLLVAALPAPGALVHRHRERAPRRRHDGCWPARPRARSRSAPLTVTAVADRIDEIEPGGWEIIDYKTGRVPSPKELEGAVRAAAPARGGDRRARRLRRDRRRGAHRAPRPTGRPTAWATAARSRRSRTATRSCRR